MQYEYLATAAVLPQGVHAVLPQGVHAVLPQGVHAVLPQGSTWCYPRGSTRCCPSGSTWCCPRGSTWCCPVGPCANSYGCSSPRACKHLLSESAACGASMHICTCSSGQHWTDPICCITIAGKGGFNFTNCNLPWTIDLVGGSMRPRHTHRPTRPCQLPQLE